MGKEDIDLNTMNITVAAHKSYPSSESLKEPPIDQNELMAAASIAGSLDLHYEDEFTLSTNFHNGVSYPSAAFSVDDIEAAKKRTLRASNPTILIGENGLDSLPSLKTTQNKKKIDRPKSIAVNDEEDKDRYNLGYFILFLFGMTTLLPWYTYITATAYYEDYKFKQVDDRRNFKQDFQSFIALAASIPNLVVMVINIFLQHRISLIARFVGSLIAIISIFAVTLIFIYIDTSASASSLFQSSTFGLAGHFPQKYTQAVANGQGLIGTAIPVIAVLSVVVNPNPTDSALAYFLSCLFVLILTLVSLIYLTKMKFIKNHVSLRNRRKSVIRNGKEVEIGKVKPEYRKVFKQIWLLLFSNWLNFFITLACFPAVCANIRSMDSDPDHLWSGKLFTPVATFLMFGLTDWIGKAAAAWIPVPKRHQVWLVICRIAFVPVFIFCNYKPHLRTIPVIFNHDGYYFVFMILFGLSNGLIGTRIMMSAPDSECVILKPKIYRSVAPNQRGLAGTMMSAFVVIGIFTGSLLSLLISHLVQM
ncbi:uncharacterized protein TRIADDRAFT_61370 [Trichoplax adhaerens]|uniref:Equilibrative nucleoside transporter 3 n=1 Tax=Trichoplax adhaerens TaxID=10228 RepID=B3SAT2_TRIAD|nr:hypothetical protein TRIADDRAFT_61370 [Trichoplax adhaerens]EDV20161.1 hypothetical protein TRIADDRAFT_61370 [Trichoplax adhaerens]|eukprot:XP_002117322.1 hypothetical protein TRIADDRAFT_61370 [Trichoplax adhaerens]